MEMTLTVGIMISKPILEMAVSGKPIHENIKLYEEYASIYGMKPIYFSIHDISVKKNTVLAYCLNENDEYHKVELPLPKVIHNRSMLFKPIHLKVIQTLLSKSIKIFNVRTRYTKNYIYSLLYTDPRMQPFLPKTIALNKGTFLFQFLRKHTSCIIKPVSNSLGRGVLYIKREAPFRFSLQYAVSGKLIVRKCNRRQLWRKIVYLTRYQSHIIQQTIQLAKYRGCPYDIRVSVQKNELGDWQVTGMVGKVAKEGHFLTNVAQGGSAIPMRTILSENPDMNPLDICNKIRDVVILASTILEKKINGIADLGYDVGLDEQGNPYIIEINGQDQRYSFELAGETEVWKNTFKNPMGYAKYLYCKEDDSLSLYPEKPISLLPVIWRPIGWFNKNIK